MSEYLADGVPIAEEEFTRRACDPTRSVVVEACAGSGKTWLLVSRIVRLLLAGAQPGEIVALTFTRRAAQEMRQRLLAELRELARADDTAVVDALVRRGLAPAEAPRWVGAARGLFERVTTARVAVTLDTFHGWFWQLVARAPLGSGVPFAPTLLEAADRLRSDAWLHCMAALLRPEHAAERAAWETLVDELGDYAARQMLLEMLARRAEWWSYAAAHADSVAQALAVFGAASGDDPAAAVRAEPFVAAVRDLEPLWRAATALKTAQSAAERAQHWLAARATDPESDLDAACALLLTKERTPTRALAPEKIAPKLGSAAERARYAHAHQTALAALTDLLDARQVWRARRINAAGLACGALLIEQYQLLKAREHAVDFTDVEWHAHRLLADSEQAAYMQARLDARCRHLLLDEFQDTNALQWQTLQHWLAAYGPVEGDGAPADRPTVFVVGDPKQSIYRFRRAEPRVFDAALELLTRDYAATHLRTNVTRRNAPAVVAALNAVMPGNPLFQAESTRVAAVSGAYVLLPLAERLTNAALPTAEDGALRDVLVVPRAEAVDDLRYREGRVIANELAQWRATLCRDGRPLRWSDALLLVRRRSHLGEYERALRDAGIPFVSDRRGGLLATLESADLVALLTVLTTPHDDHRLAHALRTPLVGCADADLIRLAAAGPGPWWERLHALQAPLTPALARARELLARWRALAGVLPVHDLLDRIYFEGDARRRYAAAAPPALRPQVQANLDAFMELALSIDAGRYPSLPRFIDELAARARGGEEAPDEGLAADEDAVRVMTIHGAKGLEAEVVVLADACARVPRERPGVLVAWPPGQVAPTHYSLTAGGGAARDGARAAWFDAEDEQCAQEDWNLLYVAATRARQVLIVSGSQPGNAPADTWYARMAAAQALSAGAAPAVATTPAPPSRSVHDFLPAPVHVGERRAAPDDAPGLRFGRVFHALLETAGRDADAVARAHGLDASQVGAVAAAAARVRASFPHFCTGAAELDVVASDGTLLRLDRLVEHDGALWVIDYKWSMGDAERLAYEAQVRRYVVAVRAVAGTQTVRGGIITAAGAFTEVH